MPGLGFDFGEFALAAAAVGTAAMGIVEGFKAIWLPPPGFSALKRSITWAKEALTNAYGTEYIAHLESLYRFKRSAGELPRILRQGVRIGLDEQNAPAMEKALLGAGSTQLASVAKKMFEGKKLEDPERNILGRFELAADARIDAALSLAERAYINSIRLWAFIIAIALSMAAWAAVKPDFGGFITAMITGLVAVPLAPIAKDVSKASKAITEILLLKYSQVGGKS